MHHHTSGHVLHTVLFTFPMELTKRICLTIRRFLNWWLFSFILMTFTFHSRVVLWGEIRSQFPLSPSKVLKDLTIIIISMTTGNMWPPPNMNLKNGSVKLNFFKFINCNSPSRNSSVRFHSKKIVVFLFHIHYNYIFSVSWEY